MASDIASELHSMVRNIVDELEAAVSGSLYDVGGNPTVIDDVDGWKAAEYAKLKEAYEHDHPRAEFRRVEDGGMYETYEEQMEDEIGTADDVDEPDEVSLHEYIEKQGLGDTRFEVDTSMRLVGGRTMFTYGGPTIWVHDDGVSGRWGSDECTMSVGSDAAAALFSWFEELWDVVRG